MIAIVAVMLVFLKIWYQFVYLWLRPFRALLLPLVWDSKSWVGLFLQCFLIAIDSYWKSHTLYWRSLLSFAIELLSVTCLKSHRIHTRLVKLCTCILLPRAKICLVTVFRAHFMVEDGYTPRYDFYWFFKPRAAFRPQFDKSSRNLYLGV